MIEQAVRIRRLAKRIEGEMTAMRVRPATDSDARAVATVQVQSWRAAYHGILSAAYLDALSIEKREITWREAIALGRPELWVAESESGVVGWVAFGPSRDADATSAVGEVEAIYVAPSHWSAGAGRGLWLAARRRLEERRFASVTLWVLAGNERAIRFYRAAGFRPEESSEKDMYLGGEVLREIRYEAQLG